MSAGPAAPTIPPSELAALERGVRRVLAVGTWLGIALLAVGVALMLVNGVSPMSETFPPFDPGRLLADVAALRPEGFLWAGVVVFIATPIARVLGELVLYIRGQEREMTLIAIAILVLVALSVVLALVTEG